MKKFYAVMLLVYALIFIMLIKRTSAERNPEQHVVSEDEIIQSNCDEPKDLAKEKNLSQAQRDYYDYLYEKTK